MKVLGLDPGQSTGWCYLDPSGATKSGVWTFKGHRSERAIAFAGKLISAIQTYAPDLVCLEEPNRYQGRGTVALAGLILVIEMTCERETVPYASVEPHKLKQFATGKGNATKPEMVAAAERLLSRSGIEEDEADAIWAAAWSLENVTLGVGP